MFHFQFPLHQDFGHLFKPLPWRPASWRSHSTVSSSCRMPTPEGKAARDTRTGEKRKDLARPAAGAVLLSTCEPFTAYGVFNRKSAAPVFSTRKYYKPARNGFLEWVGFRSTLPVPAFGAPEAVMFRAFCVFREKKNSRLRWKSGVVPGSYVPIEEKKNSRLRWKSGVYCYGFLVNVAPAPF